MRLAFIASSSYSVSQKLVELPSADADVELLGQRLAEPDAGFEVHSFRAERGLVEAVEQVLAETSEPVDELLFFFSGYAMLNDERGPALLLDGERLATFSLKRLRRILSERARSSLAVLDTVPAFDGTTSPRQSVEKLAQALGEGEARAHLMAASRPESAAFAHSPFASLFALVLDWQSVGAGELGAEGLFQAMRAEEALFAELPAAEYFPGSAPFRLLRPTQPYLSAVPPPMEAGAATSDPEFEGPDTERDSFTDSERHSGVRRPGVPEDTLPNAPRHDELAIESDETHPNARSAFAERATEPDDTLPNAHLRIVDSGTETEPVELTPRVAPRTEEVPPEARRAQALAALEAAAGEGRHGDLIAHARTALAFEPKNPELYRRLAEAFERERLPDGAWNAAMVLEALGAADVNESLLATTHRPEGLLTPQGTLGEEDWQQRIFHTERDTRLDDLFQALGRAALDAALETARRKRRMPDLDAAAEQDPAKSTTMLARTLLWSARLLGVPHPRLYLVEGGAREIGFTPAAEPTALAQKRLGSGLGLAELAFLWARRVLLLRPENRVFAWFSDPAELEALAQAAHALGTGTERAFKRLDGDAKLIARGLKRHLKGSNLEPLKAAAKNLPRRQLRERLALFSRGLELACGRAGLLACGDLLLAEQLSERFSEGWMLSPEERKADLYRYAVSEEYLALRQKLGVAVRG